MDKNTTFKYWLAVARHTSYKIGKQPRPAVSYTHLTLPTNREV